MKAIVVWFLREIKELIKKSADEEQQEEQQSQRVMFFFMMFVIGAIFLIWIDLGLIPIIADIFVEVYNDLPCFLEAGLAVLLLFVPAIAFSFFLIRLFIQVLQFEIIENQKNRDEELANLDTNRDKILLVLFTVVVLLVWYFSWFFHRGICGWG